MGNPGYQADRITTGGEGDRSVAGYAAQQIAVGEDLELMVAQILWGLDRVSESLQEAKCLTNMSENDCFTVSAFRLVRDFFEKVLREADLDGFARSLVRLLKQEHILQHPGFTLLNLDVLGDGRYLNNLLIDNDGNEFEAIMRLFSFVGPTGEELTWKAIRDLVSATRWNYRPRSVAPPVATPRRRTLSGSTLIPDYNSGDTDSEESDGESTDFQTASASTANPQSISDTASKRYLGDAPSLVQRHSRSPQAQVVQSFRDLSGESLI